MVYRCLSWFIPLFIGFQHVSTIHGGAGFLPSTVCIHSYAYNLGPCRFDFCEIILWYGDFHKWGIPNRWLVYYNGNSQSKMDDLGVPPISCFFIHQCPSARLTDSLVPVYPSPAQPAGPLGLGTPIPPRDFLWSAFLSLHLTMASWESCGPSTHGSK